MFSLEKFIKNIPTLNLSNKSKIIIGVLLLVPLYFIPWFLSLPIGVLSTSLGKYLGIVFLGRPLLRLWQMFIYYLFGLLGLKLILGRTNLGFYIEDNKLFDFLIGIIVGGGSVIIIFIIMIFSGLVKVETFAWQSMSLVSFIGLFIASIISNLGIGFMEEIPFRGYLVQVLNSSFGKFSTVVLSGLIFSFWHIIWSPLDNYSQILWLLLELIPAGLLLSWVFIYTKSLWLVIGLHASYNFMQQALDIYGRFGENNNWNNFILLGNSVHGSQILVGTPGGTAGLIQLMNSILMIIMMIFYLRYFKKSTKHDNFA